MDWPLASVSLNAFVGGILCTRSAEDGWVVRLLPPLYPLIRQLGPEARARHSQANYVCAFRDLTTDQSDAGSAGVFSRWTNQTQEARVYAHDRDQSVRMARSLHCWTPRSPDVEAIIPSPYKPSLWPTHVPLCSRARQPRNRVSVRPQPRVESLLLPFVTFPMGGDASLTPRLLRLYASPPRLILIQLGGSSK
eukprot:6266949-Pyramimonas_sp.AAC.1